MGRRLGVGMIGCGSIAQAGALCFLTDARARITFCCDSNLHRAEKFARRFGIKRVSEYSDEVINSPEVNIVYLAVPHHLHFSLMEACIKAGKPVLCEKPITTTWEDAVKIARLCRQTGVQVGVNYQYRYDLAVNRLKAAARKGILGKIYYTRINVPWNRGAAYYSGWHSNLAEAGGGTLLTHASHAIDFTQWINDCEARTAFGVIRSIKNDVETEDLGMGILELENGGLVEICSSTLARPEQAIEVQIYSEKGIARYTNQPFPWVTFTGGLLPLPEIPLNGLFAMQRSLKAFLGWVLGQGEYLIPAEQALPALASVLALYQSARKSERVYVNPATQTD